MIDTFLLIAILAFAGVFLFILGIYLYAGHHKERRDLVQRVRDAGEEIWKQNRKNRVCFRP